MRVFSVDYINSLGIRILEAAGLSKEDAETVTRHLVSASLCGVDSHGARRIGEYAELMLGIRPSSFASEPKLIKTKPEIKIIRKTASTAVMDGDFGWGFIVGEKAMRMAIEKAKTSNIAAVAAFNCGHIGRAADYVLMAVEQDMIGIVYVKSDPIMAPYGGRARMLGNNPIAYGIPAGEERPIVADLACSTVSGGKVLMYKAKGEKIPLDWLLDKEGNPTTNPADFLYGGALVPFGGYKGYALTLLGEVFAGVLAGGQYADVFTAWNNFCMTAINIEAFQPVSEFKKNIDALVRKMRNSPKAPGSKEILVPGEPEFRTMDARIREGIPLEDEYWEQIVSVAERLGVKL